MIFRGRRHRKRSGQARIAALDIARADAVLLDVLDADFAEAKRRAGPWLACRPGCSNCCYGPFPITRLDARRLRRGIEQLSATEPQRAEAVRRRAERCTQRLADGFPGDLARGRLTQDETRLDPFFEQLPDLDVSEQAYHMARIFYETAGRKLVDATIGGKLTIFPKADYDSLF